ncbi:MAG: valine--tRNA ligase, partial [Syntrophomonadaceae bacterium]|nr:valine--tRNA ligase [Syntrophomonadaceae bacterium]
NLSIVETLTEKPRQAVSALTAIADIYVPLEGVIDIDKEIARLEKDLKNADSDLSKALGKLSNDNFLSRAPQEVIEKERGKAEEARNKKEGILQRLEILSRS